MTRLFAAAAVLTAWFAAFSIELMARWMSISYPALGADLPAPTIDTFNAVRSYVPWIVAGAGTLIIGVLLFRKNARLGHACAVFVLLTALGTAWATFALALPHVKMCGSFLPEWPGAQATQAANASQAGSCGR